MKDHLRSETCWSTFINIFIILIVSTYYILCISWIMKCLITDLCSLLLCNTLITFLRSLLFPFSQSFTHCTQSASYELLIGIGAHSSIGDQFLVWMNSALWGGKISSNVYGLNIDMPPALLKLTLHQNRGP